MSISPYIILFVTLTACDDVRVEHQQPHQPGREEGDEEEQRLPSEAAESPEPRRCEHGAPIAHETFANSEWPAAWLPVLPGSSWVERHAGLMLAPQGASHGRALVRSFAAIDVAIRFVPSPSQGFSIELRGRNENKDPIVVAAEGIEGAAGRPQWIRIRVWDDFGETKSQARQWAADAVEPSIWISSVAENVAPVGALSLFVTEVIGQAPVRVEEILVCPVAVGAEG